MKEIEKEVEKEEIVAKVEMIAKDRESLINELKIAEQKEDGTIFVVTGTKDGTTNYIGYDSFRTFCDSLIIKYLKKGD